MRRKFGLELTKIDKKHMERVKKYSSNLEKVQSVLSDVENTQKEGVKVPENSSDSSAISGEGGQQKSAKRFIRLKGFIQGIMEQKQNQGYLLLCNFCA